MHPRFPTSVIIWHCTVLLYCRIEIELKLVLLGILIKHDVHEFVQITFLNCRRSLLLPSWSMVLLLTIVNRESTQEGLRFPAELPIDSPAILPEFLRPAANLEPALQY